MTGRSGETVQMWTSLAHVAIVRRKWRLTRYYVDGKRVRRSHPVLRKLGVQSYARKVLGL
jgi:hypothetical protein